MVGGWGDDETCRGVQRAHRVGLPPGCGPFRQSRATVSNQGVCLSRSRGLAPLRVQLWKLQGWFGFRYDNYTDAEHLLGGSQALRETPALQVGVLDKLQDAQLRLNFR